MSRHRLAPVRRVRPRYGRMAAAGLSLAVTMVALLGGLGVIPLQTARGGSDAAAAASRTDASVARTGTSGPTGTAGADNSGASRSRPDPAHSGALKGDAKPDTADPSSTALPSDSGQGRRVVFSRNAQRVWLVNADGGVASTYLVSGSLTDNLEPGKYHVYSRSRWAVGIQDSGIMQYFVRFARGQNAAIGFHSIPTKNGTPLQTAAQLGTPQSHGCIRQKRSDAQRMWAFAGIGTEVVVVA